MTSAYMPNFIWNGSFSRPRETIIPPICRSFDVVCFIGHGLDEVALDAERRAVRVVRLGHTEPAGRRRIGARRRLGQGVIDERERERGRVVVDVEKVDARADDLEERRRLDDHVDARHTPARPATVPLAVDAHERSHVARRLVDREQCPTRRRRRRRAAGAAGGRRRRLEQDSEPQRRRHSRRVLAVEAGISGDVADVAAGRKFFQDVELDD